MYVTLRQPGTGKPVTLKVGFSWFFLLLSWIYGLGLFVKGLWGHGLLMFALCALTAIAGQGGAAPVFGIAIIGAMIFYGVQGNKLLARKLLIKGWKMEGDEAALAYARAKWGLSA